MGSRLSQRQKVICTTTERCFLLSYENGFLISDNKIVSSFRATCAHTLGSIRRDVILPFTCPTDDYSFHWTNPFFVCVVLGLSAPIPGHLHKFMVIPIARPSGESESAATEWCSIPYVYLLCLCASMLYTLPACVTNKYNIYFDCRYLPPPIETI